MPSYSGYQSEDSSANDIDVNSTGSTFWLSALIELPLAQNFDSAHVFVIVHCSQLTEIMFWCQVDFLLHSSLNVQIYCVCMPINFITVLLIAEYLGCVASG